MALELRGQFLKNLKSTGDLKHGKDNSCYGDYSKLKSVSRLRNISETGPKSVDGC